MPIRELKSWRRDDRGYAVRNLLDLREWDPATTQHTGFRPTARVTHLARGPAYEIPEGFAVLSVDQTEAGDPLSKGSGRTRPVAGQLWRIFIGAIVARSVGGSGFERQKNPLFEEVSLVSAASRRDNRASPVADYVTLIRLQARETMAQLQAEGHVPGRFPTTQWSRVVTATGRDGTEAREALSGLCQAYWYPIYAYIRHRGCAPEQARDVTQDFFAYVLEHQLFAKADPARGRFRAFLRTVCGRHLADRRDRDRAAKRGGGRPLLSIDPFDAERRYAREPAHELTPDRIFDRTWALTLLDRVVERLRREYDDAGRADKFEELITLLTRDSATESYSRIAERLGTSEGNVRVAVHRLRCRYGLLLREEIAATVGDSALVEDEVQALFAALAR